MTEFTPTRTAGLSAMHAFVPAMGERYQIGRNYDHGLGMHSAVSVLSPYIRRRLVSEQEVVAAALVAHGPDAAKTYIEEVIWREYAQAIAAVGLCRSIGKFGLIFLFRCAPHERRLMVLSLISSVSLYTSSNEKFYHLIKIA